MPAGEHLYEQLADRLAHMIERGALRPGERLPSVRRLSRQHRVSVSTVVQAYALLESRGVVETRPQSGHYVRMRRQETVPEPRPARPRVVATRPSVQGLVAEVYRALRDPLVVPFGAAMTSTELLPVEALSRALSGQARAAGGFGASYDPPPGSPALRRQLARRAVSLGCALGADDFVTTVGCAEALHLCLRAATRPGDTVAVESPAYYGLLQLIEILGLRAVELPLHPRTGLEVDALAEAARRQRIKACLVTPSFGNPIGSRMPDEAKARLVELCTREEIALIEDDICGDLFDPYTEGATRPRPAKAFDTQGWVMLCSSFSKTLASGLRVGYTAPGRFREAVEHLKFAHTVATATVPQLAVAELLESGAYERHLRTMRRRLATQVQQVREAVAQWFPPGTRVSRPQGGFLLWVEMLPGTSALELHARALERGISIAPGPIFSASQRFTNCIRLSCGHPFTDAAEHAIRQLGRLAAELATSGAPASA